MPNFFIYFLVFLAFGLWFLRWQKQQFDKHGFPEPKTRERTSKPKGDFQVIKFDDGGELRYRIIFDVNKRVLLRYENSDGDVTNREVTTIQVQKRENAWYLYAYCHLREEPRHFRIARIRELVDLESGEVVTKKFVDYLKPNSCENT